MITKIKLKRAAVYTGLYEKQSLGPMITAAGYKIKKSYMTPKDPRYACIVELERVT